MAARQDYELFYRKEMEMRKAQSYPPYTYLASVIVSGKVEETVIDNTYDVIDLLNEHLKGEAVVLGPTVPFVPYENNNHLRLIIIKYKDQEKVRKVLKNILSLYVNKGNVSLSVNIDPYNL